MFTSCSEVAEDAALLKSQANALLAEAGISGGAGTAGEGSPQRLRHLHGIPATPLQRRCCACRLGHT